MNQRRETRLQADQSVAVTLFGDPVIRLSGRVRNVSGRGIGLELDVPVAAGTALKVELEDALLLGEVIYCRTDEASYYVGVELEHALNGLAELSRIVSAFNDAIAVSGSSPQRAHAVAEGGHQSQQQSH
jgi:hypothetical protein